jgi:prepilin-type N-terminal cleavage/methylation domain-containing protein
MKLANNASQSKGFTLVEIMIVVAIIALLATIAVPSFLRARKRSQATKILNSARVLEAAIDQWAIEKNVEDGEIVTFLEVKEYIDESSTFYQTGLDIFGNPFRGPANDLHVRVGRRLEVDEDSYNVLSDVTDEDFWGTYYPTN